MGLRSHTALAEFCQDNVMVAFCGTKTWWSFSATQVWRWPRMRPTHRCYVQPKVTVDAGAHWWHSHRWCEKSCFGRAHSFASSQIHGFNRDDVWTRWWGDISEENTSTSCWWKDGDSHPSQALGSVVQASAFVKETAEQTFSRSQQDWASRHNRTAETSWSRGASIYRSCVGILLYLSPDLPQCQYVIRYLSTCASKPTQKAMVVLKHLVGYMAGHSDQYVSLKWKGMHAGLMRDYECEESVLEVFSDADWAADRDTRRSVSGSAIFYGGCLVYSSSRTQKIVSLSSAESETYAAASAVMDTILIRTILCWVLQVRILMYLYLDSSAARGVLSRRGVGRLRHLSCRVLWLQNLVGDKLLQVKAVLGTINPADVSTKRLSIARLESLMYLFGLWSTVQNQLVGSDDPGRIFRHLPQQALSNSGRNSHLRLLISALSLLTLQLQGCEAISSEMVDIPHMFTAVWIGLLGMYLFWMAKSSKRNRGTRDEPSFDSGFPTADDDVDTASVASCGTEDTDEYPPFSPEGLISWLFERCNRRFENALTSGDHNRAHAYNQRRVLLADFMNFVTAAGEAEREQACDMLNGIDDLSSHGSSSTKNSEEEDERGSRVKFGHQAMIALQSTMAVQLQGCSTAATTTSEGSSWFSFAFLMTWTLLLAGYSWYMLRNMGYHSRMQMPHWPFLENLK